MTINLRGLKVGQNFQFFGSDLVWEYRGNGWYWVPGGEDGGPWHSDNKPVRLYECPGCGENHCPGCIPAAQNLSCFI